jgi:hypothetical protein
VKVFPEATVAGRVVLPQLKIAELILQLGAVIAVFAVHVTWMVEVEATITEPKVTGLGVHVTGALDCTPPPLSIMSWPFLTK